MKTKSKMTKWIFTLLLCLTVVAFTTPALADSWTTKAAMPTARSDPYGASIGGLLYVVGGNTGASGVTGNLEVYNPSTNTWVAKASIPGPVYQGAIGVIDNKLYVVGGWNWPISGIPTRKLQIYNPATNTWSNGADMPILNGCSVAGVINRKLYVLTACDGYSGYRKYLHEYNPDTNSWTGKAQPPNTHAYGAGGVIDGKFYVAGGQDGSGTIVTAMLDVYDPATNTWTTKASMPTVRGGASAGVINGQLYVIGGWSTTNPPAGLATLVVYDPATNTWTTKTSMSRARYALAAGVINDQLYVVGGYDGSNPLATLEVFSTVTAPKDNVLYAEKRTVMVNESVLVPINIKNATNIGNMDILLTYDPKVVKATKVQKGSLTSDTLFDSNVQVAGEIRISFASAQGIKGDGGIAYLEFQAIGSPNSTSPVTFVEAFANEADTFAKLNATFSHGEVRISEIPPLKGDVNRDGVVNAADALMALKMAVGQIPATAAADVNGDGRVTSVDALLILQAATGKITL